MDYYKQIFKCKSFHIFKDTNTLVDSEIQELKEFIKTVKPLNSEIKTEICIVPENDTTCKRGGEFCVLFYSETKDEYLRNIHIWRKKNEKVTYCSRYAKRFYRYGAWHKRGGCHRS